MRYRYALMPLLLGLFFSAIGFLLRVLHWSGGNWLQLAGLAGIGGGLVLVLLRLGRGAGSR